MPRVRSTLLLSCLLLLCWVHAAPADELKQRLSEVLDGPDYKQAHWGMLVVDADTGKPLFEQNADRLFAPASVTKLFSCAAALCEFGPNHRFETPVYRRGSVEKETLRGDLILVASGDLTMGGRTDKQGVMLFKDHDHTYAHGTSETELTDTDPLAGLVALAKHVRQAGIRKVTGDVLIDARLFDSARGSGSGPDQLTPILINDNVVDFVVTPGKKAGDLATIKMRPETTCFQVDARIETVEKGEPKTSIHLVTPGRLTLRGRIAANSKPIVIIHAVENPAVFARALFIECLKREGVEVEGSPLQLSQGQLPERDEVTKLTRVALLTSPPLSEALKVTLKVSNNLYASTLPLLLAAKNQHRTLAAGMRQQQKQLAALGLDTKTISFGGAAGGDRADKVSPRATVQLLLAMRKRPDFAVYRAALPVLGVDGTLAGMVDAKSPARGKVNAKTGTLGAFDRINERQLLHSKALAGYLTTAKGQELAFAMFVNDVPLPPGVTATREGRVLGKLCEIIHQYAP